MPLAVLSLIYICSKKLLLSHTSEWSGYVLYTDTRKKREQEKMESSRGVDDYKSLTRKRNEANKLAT